MNIKEKGMALVEMGFTFATFETNVKRLVRFCYSLTGLVRFCNSLSGLLTFVVLVQLRVVSSNRSPIFCGSASRKISQQPFNWRGDSIFQLIARLLSSVQPTCTKLNIRKLIYLWYSIPYARDY